MIDIQNKDALTYLKRVSPESIDLIILDPDYQDWERFISEDIVEKCMVVLKQTGNILCFTKQPFDYELRNYVNKWFRREIVWTFENGGAWCSPKMPLVSFQKIYWLTKGSDFYFQPRTGVDYSEATKDFKRSEKVWQGYKQEGRTFEKSDEGIWLRDHLHYNKPNTGAIPAKPKELIDIFVRCFCPPNGTVLDLFSRSGIIPIVCQENDKNCMASEINKDRCAEISKQVKANAPKQLSLFD